MSQVMTTSTDLSLARVEGLHRRDAFRTAGLPGRFDGATMAGIPDLWDRFVAMFPVAGQRGGETYGLCLGSDKDEGGFAYVAAVQIDAVAPAPAGLEGRDIPAQSYVVFRQALAAGPLQPQMRAAAQEIWGQRLAALGLTPSGGPDFELYPAGFDPQNLEDAHVEYWAPVIP